MIEISDTAQQYFKRLIGQQDEEGLGLRIAVNHPGTPGASCDLQFSPEGQSMQDDHVVDYDGFKMFVADASMPWLNEATIDFEEDETGGQLTIKAPGIKGTAPSSGDSKPASSRSKVVLPLPLGPNRTSTSPAATSSETLSSTLCSPKLLLRRSISRKADML